MYMFRVNTWKDEGKNRHKMQNCRKMEKTHEESTGIFAREHDMWYCFPNENVERTFKFSATSYQA